MMAPKTVEKLEEKIEDVGFIGKSAKNVSANDLMWEFFQAHE